MYREFFKVAKISIVAALFTLVSFNANARLDLSRGTITAAGGVTGNVQLVKPKEAKEIGTGFLIKSEAGLGYFVADNWSVGLSLPIVWAFKPEEAKTLNSLSLRAETTYYFDIDSALFPYLGVNAAPTYETTPKTWAFATGLDLGLLVSLSEGVGLDLAVKPNFIWPQGEKGWRLDIPVGYFGVKAFF
jgi:hypothetical protein